MKKVSIFVMLLLFGISLIVAAECGDVNSDGAVDIVDALLIAHYYVGLNPANFDSTVADVNDTAERLAPGYQGSQHRPHRRRGYRRRR